MAARLNKNELNGAWELTGTVTVASGQSVSDAIPMDNILMFSAQLPSNIDSATSITLQASLDGGTFGNLYNSDGTEVTIPVSASRVVTFDGYESILALMQYIKIRLGTSSSPVTATADRVITLTGRG